MTQLRQKALETALFLRQRVDLRPEVGFLTGTGLGDSAQIMEVLDTLEYQHIPHFPVATVESHAGRLLLGHIKGCPAVALQGRFHLYEGYSPQEVTFPVRVMQELGIKTLILSNAAGGLNPAFQPGDIMIVDDHINLSGHNPLIGANQAAWGERFPDMTRAYDPELAALAQKVGQASGIALQHGIYAGLQGPSLETPAEVRFLKTIGAEAVGFSTVQEVIAAVHAGMRVLGLSTITNINDPDHPQPATVAEIIAVAAAAAPKLGKIISGVVEQLLPARTQPSA